MKIKHILTLFCVTLTLAFLLVSCADTSGDGGGSNTNGGGDNGSNTNGGGDTTEKQFSNVSAESCGDSTLELNCFISVWDTANAPTDKAIKGVSDTNIVKLPLVKGGTYDFYVDWGDGKDVEKIEAYDAHEVTHNYDESGTYTIHIAGTIKGWRFFLDFTDQGDAAKLADVKQWGSLSLGNTAGRQFYGAENFNPTATDAPDVSETTSLHSAFSGASNFNGEIGNWDVSTITTMEGMFNGASSFNNNGMGLDWGDKTSNVTDMEGMFSQAIAFNQDISGWNVGKVTNMAAMFYAATSFNNAGMALAWGDKTSNVTDMNSMFLNASAFNQDISKWDVAKVAASGGFADGSKLDDDNVPYKFRGANAVSKEVCEAKPELNCFISVWNTANVPTDTTVTGYSGTKMVKLPLVNNGEYNFYVDWGDGEDVEKIEAYDDLGVTHNYDESGTYTIHITGTIKGWRFFVSAFDQAAGTDNDYGDAAKLTGVTQWGSLSLGNTDGSQFQGAQNFNPTATDAPDLSETTDLNNAFASASNFNADISDWDVSQVTDMKGMFANATSFNNNGKPLDWGNITSKVTDMSRMFSNANVFNQDISDWDVGEVTYMSFMFSEASRFNNNGKPLDWGDKTSNVTDMNSMFNGASVFNQAIGDWKVSEVTDMNTMFWSASVFNQDICYWNVENVGQFASLDFAKGSALENKNNPFKAECTARKSN